MARTVKVGLDVDEAPYTRGVERATKATEKLDDALDDVTGSAKDTAAATERAKDSTDDLGDSAKDAAKDLDLLRERAGRLDRQIDETARGIRNLARDIAATSDEAARAELTKKLLGEQGKLRQQLSLRKLIDVDTGGAGADIGAAIAGQASVSFAAKFGPLLARVPMSGALVSPAVAAIGAPIAAGVASLVGAALAGAVIGAAAGGGIIGGVTIAAQHPAVKAAAKATGDTWKDELAVAAQAFVPETLSALAKIRGAALDLGDDLERVFSASSRYVSPLTDSFLAGGERAVEGFATAVERAGPVVESIGRIAERAGDLVGDTFEQLSEHAVEAGWALEDLWTIVDAGARGLVIAVSALAETYKWFKLLTAVTNPELFARLVAEEHNAKIASEQLNNKLGPLAGGLHDVGGEAVTAEQAMKDLKTAFDDLFNQEMGYDRAVIAAKEGLADLNKELREGKRSLNENTAAGRDNRTAVLDQIEKIKELRDARIDQGESMDTVNGKYRNEIGAIREKLEKLGYEQTEIDELIGKYEDIPEQVKTRVDAETIQAERNLQDVRDLIKQIKSKKVVITTQHNEIVTRSEGRNAPIGDGVGGRRWGGVVEHAQWGRLREAEIAAPVAPARYAWAEPATGGEAFIPRFGNPDRSLDILSQAARWYGHAIVPAGMGGGAAAGGGVPEVRVFIGDQELRGMVRVEVSEHNRGLKRRVGAGAGRV